MKEASQMYLASFHTKRDTENSISANLGISFSLANATVLCVLELLPYQSVAILGWLFIFPLPLTLILIKKKIKPIVKYIIIAIAWLLYLFIVIGSANSDSSNTTTTDGASTLSSSENETTATASTAESSNTDEGDDLLSSEKSLPVLFESDEIVNNFLISFNNVSESPFENIEDGNIRTKAFARSQGYWCTLLHANDTDKILVTIEETDETADAGVGGMRTIFHDVVITIDPSLSDDEIYAYFDKMIADLQLSVAPFWAGCSSKIML